jgi:hypothetical protein
MRATLLLALLTGVTGCISANSTTTRTASVETERLRALEARVARLEARPSDLEDEILALKVERAALVVSHDPSHSAVVTLDGRIRALEQTRKDERRARREQLARRLEVERQTLLATYTAESDQVRKLDAQIAFLKSDAP